jgi:hypothetical protein
MRKGNTIVQRHTSCSVFAEEGTMEVTDTRFTLRPFCSPHKAQKHLVRDMCEVFADNSTYLDYQPSDTEAKENYPAFAIYGKVIKNSGL